MPRIAFQDFPQQWRMLKRQAFRTLENVGRSGQWVLGPAVGSFETALARRWGHKFAIGCASGLDALVIALRCAGVKRGQRVLTTPLSAFATTLAILQVGGVPVFVDVDPQGLLDLNLCERLVARGGIRFILPVHLYGRALDLDRLALLQRKYRVQIIEDCAQSIDATDKARCTGSVGAIAATSFYPTKNLGGWGDGGAVLTSNARWAERARRMRHYGQKETYLHTEFGLNSRLDALHAAFLEKVFLPHLDGWTQKRREIAERYGLEIRHPRLKPLHARSREAAWHLFPLLVQGDRKVFQTYLAKRGIATAVHYPRLATQQPVMRQFTYEAKTPLTNALSISRHEVSLPLHPYLSKKEVDFIVATCNAWS